MKGLSSPFNGSAEFLTIPILKKAAKAASKKTIQLMSSIATIFPHKAGKINAPDLIECDDASCPHQVWACWDNDDEDPAHTIFWLTRDNRIVIKGIISNKKFRGRAMLQWIASAYRLPIHVVEVIPSAIGFWEKMRTEGIIHDWDPSDGFASPLERLAVPINLKIAA